MEAEDVVNLIQHYRHDLMNELQVVQGYIKLGNLEKVDASMTELLDYFYQERKLLSLNAPNVFLWFMQFRLKYENFILTYDIDIENKNLSESDIFIGNKLEQIMRDAIENCSNEALHRVEIEFKDSIDTCEIAVYVVDESEKLHSIEKKRINQSEIEDIDINIASNEYRYSFHVSYQ